MQSFANLTVEHAFLVRLIVWEPFGMVLEGTFAFGPVSPKLFSCFLFLHGR